MMEWWLTREPRERVLLSIAAGLTVLMLLYFGLARPLSNARSSANQSLASAQTDLSIVERGIGVLQSTSVGSAGAARDVDAFRALLTRSARDAGLSIARVQNGATGTVQIRLDDTDPPQLFNWLAEIENQPGGEIMSASITTRNDERIEAVIELRGGQR